MPSSLSTGINGRAYEGPLGRGVKWDDDLAEESAAFSWDVHMYLYFERHT